MAETTERWSTARPRSKFILYHPGVSVSSSVSRLQPRQALHCNANSDPPCVPAPAGLGFQLLKFNKYEHLFSLSMGVEEMRILLVVMMCLSILPKPCNRSCQHLVPGPSEMRHEWPHQVGSSVAARCSNAGRSDQPFTLRIYGHTRQHSGPQDRCQAVPRIPSTNIIAETRQRSQHHSASSRSSDDRPTAYSSDATARRGDTQCKALVFPLRYTTRTAQTVKSSSHTAMMSPELHVEAAECFQLLKDSRTEMVGDREKADMKAGDHDGKVFQHLHRYRCKAAYPLHEVSGILHAG